MARALLMSAGMPGPLQAVRGTTPVVAPPQIMSKPRAAHVAEPPPPRPGAALSDARLLAEPDAALRQLYERSGRTAVEALVLGLRKDAIHCSVKRSMAKTSAPSSVAY